jgi:carboxylesterase
LTDHPFAVGPDHDPFVIGQGDPQVLMLHGFPGTPRELRPLAERFAAAGWTAHGILLPGFGREIATLDERSGREWVNAARKSWHRIQQRGGPTAIVGYSFGTTIATALAAREPPDRLILIAPFWRLGVPGAFLVPVLKHVVRTVAPFRLASFDDPRMRRYFSENAPELDIDDPNVQAAIRRRMTISTRVIDEVRRLGLRSLVNLRRIESPLLVVQSRSDDTVPVAATRHLLRYPAGPVRYVELDGGHDLVRLNSPGGEGLVRAVLDFVAGP